MKLRILLIISFFILAKASSGSPPKKLVPFFSNEASQWADSMLKTLTPAQRVAQLIMVAAWSNKDSIHIKEIDRLIKDYGIGGLIFFQGGPVREALLTNYYQSVSKVPLLIGMDAEWGLAMRIDSTVRFPRQMTMSAIKNDSMVYLMGVEVARECTRLGIHINFAPDADINNNPCNPIIGSRSFGDDREVVTRNSLMYMNALQDHHILATGKHFPGHGNVDTDSHLTLPVIKQTAEEMDTVEFYPFRKLINEGITGMMVAHLNVPALDSTANLPSTLSSSIIKGILREKMGFEGLIFTDALNMKGVSANYKPGILDKLAFKAGNDVLLYCEDVKKAIEMIMTAVDSSEITQAEIDSRAKKVLMAKYWCGLNHYKLIDTTNLYKDLNNPEALLLQRNMFEQSVTVLFNKDSVLPLSFKDNFRIASVVIGDKKENAFQKQLKQYYNVDLFEEDKDAPTAVWESLFRMLSAYDYVIVSLHGTTMKAQTNYGIPEAVSQFVDSAILKYKTLFVDFGNAYTLTRFKNLKKSKAIVLAYEDFPLMQTITAQMIMGGLKADGRLPVNSSGEFQRSFGVNTSGPVRFSYTLPEAAGINSVDLLPIDSIVKNAINAGAMPGCQILIAKDGKVIYQKAFGTKTYETADSVRITDLYDIASVTKIAATALGTMRLYEQHKLDLNQPVSKYYPRLKSSNKKQIIIRDVLTHQAGLQAWIPFYKETLFDSAVFHAAFNETQTSNYRIRVAENLFMNEQYEDSITQWILNSPLTERGRYIYSDLGPILMKSVIEKQTSNTLDNYLTENFYAPLGLTHLTFKPREKYALREIVPTEKDTIFRKQLIHGDVHDPAAAMMGGVSGNAGLFSTANDLAVVMQMLLNGGSYGGQRFLKSTTVDEFTTRTFPGTLNRRGLFFDKPETDKSKPSPCAKQVSDLTFGHQGFTGTCVWVDPKYNLVYVFLSNRVYPDAGNEKLAKMNVRTSIQESIYKAMKAGELNNRVIE